jgi:ribosomal protein S18 acetylase RimI-like enzyme
VFGIGQPIVGIAIWRRPHQQKHSLSSVFSSIFSTARMYLLLLAMNPRIITFLEMLSFFRSSDALHHRYAPTPHYHLETLAVHPRYQGQGYATRLLQPLLDQADIEAIGTYTETMTPRNVELYEHFGFHCTAQQNFPSTNLTLWALYRHPKRVS